VGAALESIQTSPPDGALDHWQSADRQACGRGGIEKPSAYSGWPCSIMQERYV
jgi:hypothetical protein